MGKLFYYEDNSSGATSLGFVDIDAAKEIVVVASSQASTFTFEIRTKSTRVYVLRAASEAELRYWVDGLNQWLQWKANNPLLEEQERLKSRLAELQSKVNRQSAMLASQNADKEENVLVLRQYVADLRAQNGELLEMLTEKDNRIGALQQALDAAVAERDRLATESDFKSQIEPTLKKVEELESRIEDEKDAAAELIVDLQTRVEDFEAREATWQEEKEALTKDQMDMAKRLSVLQEERDSAVAALEDVKKGALLEQRKSSASTEQPQGGPVDGALPSPRPAEGFPSPRPLRDTGSVILDESTDSGPLGSCTSCQGCGKYRPHAFRKNQCRICYHAREHHVGAPFTDGHLDDAAASSAPVVGRMDVQQLESIAAAAAASSGDAMVSPRPTSTANPKQHVKRKSWIAPKNVPPGAKALKPDGTVDLGVLAAKLAESETYTEAGLMPACLAQLKSVGQLRGDLVTAQKELHDAREAHSMEIASQSKELFRAREEKTRLATELSSVKKQLEDTVKKYLAEIDTLSLKSKAALLEGDAARQAQAQQHKVEMDKLLDVVETLRSSNKELLAGRDQLTASHKEELKRASLEIQVAQHTAEEAMQERKKAELALVNLGTEWEGKLNEANLRSERSLEQCRRDHGAELTTLTRKYEADASQLRASLTQTMESALGEQLRELETKHRGEIEALIAKQENTVVTIKGASSQAVEAANRAHAAELASINASQAEEKAQWKASAAELAQKHEMALAALRKEHADTLAEIKIRHAIELEKLQTARGEERTQFKAQADLVASQHESALQAAEARHTESTTAAQAALTALQSKMEAAVAEEKARARAELDAVVQKHTGEVKSLNAALTESEARANQGIRELGGETERLLGEIAALRQAHASALQEEQSKARSAADAIGKKHEAELASQRAHEAESLRLLEEKHEAESAAATAERTQEKLRAKTELETLLKKHETHLASMKATWAETLEMAKRTHEADLESLRSSHDAALAKAKMVADAAAHKHEHELTALRTATQADLEAAHAQHAATLEALKAAQETERVAASKQHAAELATLSSASSSQVAQLVAAHEAAIAALSKEHEQLASNASSQHEARLAALQKELDAATELVAEHMEKLDALGAEVKQLQGALAAEQAESARKAQDAEQWKQRFNESEERANQGLRAMGGETQRLVEEMDTLKREHAAALKESQQHHEEDLERHTQENLRNTLELQATWKSALGTTVKQAEAEKLELVRAAQGEKEALLKQAQEEKAQWELKLKAAEEERQEQGKVLAALKDQLALTQGDASRELAEVRVVLETRERELATVMEELKESRAAVVERVTLLDSTKEDHARVLEERSETLRASEAKLAEIQEAHAEKEAEMLEHITDLEEDLLATQRNVSELQELVLQRSRELLEKERELADLVKSKRPVEELESELAVTEEKRIAAELKAEDLREELEKVTKFNDRTNKALLQTQEELAALRVREQRAVAAAGGGSSSSSSNSSKSVAQELERYKSALVEQQNHNVFLARECARMEGEMAATLVAKEKTTAYLLYNLREVTSKMREYRRVVFLRVAGEGDLNRDSMLATLENVDELRKQLFFSKAIAMKVDRASRGLATNINVADLWARAEAMPISEFDRFLGLELGKEK